MDLYRLILRYLIQMYLLENPCMLPNSITEKQKELCLVLLAPLHIFLAYFFFFLLMLVDVLHAL